MQVLSIRNLFLVLGASAPSAWEGLAPKPHMPIDVLHPDPCRFGPACAGGIVLGPRRDGMNGLALPLIPGITPDLLSSPCSKSGSMYIGDRGRGRADRVHNASLGIHPEVRPHSEVPLVAFLRLMHLRIALLVFVLGRRRRVNVRCIHDCSRFDTDALALQTMVHRVQHLAAQFALFQQMTEVKNRRLVRNRARPRSMPAKRRRTRDSNNASSTPGSDSANHCCRK